MVEILSPEAPILPGSWIGMLGGGQLGRMFAHAAQQLGYHVAIFEHEANCPAAQAADAHFQPKDNEDEIEVLRSMLDRCAALTLEFENVDARLLREAGRTTLTHPSADFLAICQDRIREKRSLSAAGFPTTPFRQVASTEEAQAAAEEFGWPMVLKTATSGYDGKGQAMVRSLEELPEALQALNSDYVVAEQWIEFEAEVSMITARNRRGDLECYPLLENAHENHILDVSRCPANADLQKLDQAAQEICRGVAESFGVVGLFCIEFFVTKSGELLINEIAPRPHNSGHLTMNSFTCSQFEQQVRAVCNLPLVKPQQIRPAAMINLLGEVWQNGEPNWEQVLGCRDAHLHLYGKAEARPGRKMGHINVLDDSSSEAAITARELRERLCRETEV